MLSINAFQELRGKMLEALNISNSILTDKKELVKTVDAIRLELPGISERCTSIPRLSDLLKPIIDEVQQSTADIKQYSENLQSSITSANDSMNKIVSLTEEVDTAVGTSQKYFSACVWTSTIFFIVLLVMLVGSIFVTYEISNFLTKVTNSVWLWPVFSVLLILNWLFVSLFFAASLSGSDICVQPDAVTYSVLAANSEGLDTTIYLNLVNYITVGHSFFLQPRIHFRSYLLSVCCCSRVVRSGKQPFSLIILM